MTHPNARPLGRVVNHDPRSLAYLVGEHDATPVTVRWDRHIPVLDQVEVGSCTGNAAVGALGTDPAWPALTSVSQSALTETFAVSIYSSAEVIDGGVGYPPQDDGSSGLSVAKVCKARGLISGYTHITSIAAAQTAIKTGPFIVGSNWYTSMDSPNNSGVVTISGTKRGEHEYECIGYNASSDLWEMVNSWGPSFGLHGHFYYSTATFTRLLSEDGDATVLLPLNVPAPTPAPPPLPTPAADADHALAQAVRPWVTARHAGSNAKAAKAVQAWLTAKGL